MNSIPNLRVTFWGVQGTCPVFPTHDETAEYTRQVASAAIEKTLLDIANRSEKGGCTSAALRQLTSPDQLNSYQRSLALPDLAIFGGDTTCIEVLTRDGDTLLFDMGSGMRAFSRQATAPGNERRNREIHVFASHEHLDHRLGLPFSSICFESMAPFSLHIHGTRAFLNALDEHYGIFSKALTPQMYVDDPLDYRMIAAKFTAAEIRGDGPSDLPFPAATHKIGEPIEIGSTSVTPFEVFHGKVQCLGYKVTSGQSSFVFATDHELRRGDDPNDDRQIRSLNAERRLIEYCQDADVAYVDGQYLLAEYRGDKGIGTGKAMSRMDWGHSCIEDVIERASKCNIRKTIVGHHDPERPWTDRIDLDRHLRQLFRGTQQIQLAKCGEVVEI